ncbi:hypothetical protein M885DRAFT_475505 [Pelagophyceae sp. CCMP2097]|nr:hypothetical protein M885DRAFT_475505 [Pelagophyceae sp. CCMP2097]
MSVSRGFAPRRAAGGGPRRCARSAAPRPSAPRASPARSTRLCASRKDDEPELFGGYTAKQRIREEIDSPFRKVRIAFFGFSAFSALIALYFSGFAAAKALNGGFGDSAPLDETLRSVGINLAAVGICAGITANDLKAAEADLKRIAKGGRLAKLRVLFPADSQGRRRRFTLSDFRNQRRVVLAVGGKEYVDAVAASISGADMVAKCVFELWLKSVDVVVVPVLLGASGSVEALEAGPFGDAPCALALGLDEWSEYLEDELETAKKQGYDPVEKGLGIYVKKNGKILRRATGLPQWDSLVATMDVMDGNAFGGVSTF